MDFGALPPEINSASMYSGAGVSSLVEAGQAWGTLAADLTSSAAQFASAAGSLDGIWLGAAASAMRTSATRYLSWVSQTAEMAAQSSVQAAAAATAYQMAFAATVNPAVVATNRVQLAVLTATNFLGQNSAAIAANEAMYSEFWAQDAAAMYAYQAQSPAATSALPQFQPAPQTTSGSTAQGLTQAAAVTNPLLQFIETLIPGYVPGQPLQNLAFLLTSPLGLATISSGALMGPFTTDPLGLLGAFLGLVGAAEGSQAAGAAASSSMIPRFPTMISGSAGAHPSVLATRGEGVRVGGLSTPSGWAQVRPETSAARVDVNVPNRFQAAIPAVPFMPVAGMGKNTRNNTSGIAPKYGNKPTVMPGHPWGG